MKKNKDKNQMKLRITNKVKIKSPKEKFKIILNFSENESVSKMTFKKDEESEIFKWVTLFKEYKNKLDKDWNSWCNVEIDNIMNVSNEFNLDFDEDDILDVWKDHPDYECLDMPEYIDIYYYNEDGVKFNVEVD